MAPDFVEEDISFALISIMIPNSLYITTSAHMSVGTGVILLLKTQISFADATFPHFCSALHLVMHDQYAEYKVT